MEPRRIVLVRTSHLGDVVHALPVWHALRGRYPRAELAWVVQAESASLVEGLPGLARAFRFGRRDGWRAWPRLRRELRAFGPDLAVDAQGNLKSAAATWCSGAPRCLGLARGDWREPLGARVLTERAEPARGVHALDRARALAEAIAGAGTDLRLDPELTEEERARGRRLADRWLAGASGARPPVVLQVARAGDVRSWPLERQAELARRLLADSRALYVLAGPAEEREGAFLTKELGERPGLASGAGGDGLRELAALFAEVARRGGVMVACDSGPAHLAAACGLKVVSLFGSTEFARTGPRGGAGGRVVRAAVLPECAPCRRRRCVHPEGVVCMARIEVEAVLAELAGLEGLA